MRAALIYNPLSGSRHSRRQQIISAIISSLGDRGWSVSALPTSHAGHATELAATAAPHNDIILAAGGDGTAHEILQALVGTNCALGVLPFGTGNVLATDIGLPRDPVLAATKLLSYAPRRIAAGRIDYLDRNRAPASRYFIVAAGIGGHARLIYDAGAYAKKHGGLGAYYYTGFRSLLTHRFEPMHVSITAADRSTIERTAVEVVAMRVSSFGGLLKHWRPGGRLLSDDLRVVLLTRANRAALLRYSLAAFAGRTTQSAGIEFHSASAVTCSPLASLATSIVHTQADGEILGIGAPVTMSIVPNAVTLLMPPDSTTPR